MKLKKRMISLFLAIAMFACLIPSVGMTAQAATSGYEVVAYARQYLGCDYKLGTSGPKTFDCAGFVHYVFKHFGIDLPKNASAYFYNPTKYGTLIDKGSIEKAQMGDVIAWEGHVAIYTEDGRCVEALGTDYGVCDWVKVNRHTNGMNYKVIRIKGITSINDPKISSLSSTNSGVEIKWGKVANAEKYRVYRKTGNGSWVALGNTTATSFIDKTAVSGTTYMYTVRCISADGKNFTSGYDDQGKSIKPLSTPKLSSVTDTTSGITIKWNNVTGAAKYRVYYKTGSGDWTKIADTTSASYVWKGAQSGTKYKFTVRCVSSDGKTFTSGYDTAGLSLTYIAAPKLLSVSQGNSGTVIKWEKVKGAEKYRVYYEIGSGKWSKIADTTDTSYTWTNAERGKAYTFTVRCVSKDGSTFASLYDTKGKSLKIANTPELSDVSNTSTGVKISWKKASGAELYRVYYKNSSGGWTKIADTASTSYTWTGAKSGTNYTFTVRCITGDGKVFTSGYDTKGRSIKYIAAPKISSVSPAQAGIQISWGKVAGAELYRVYYKNSSGGWTKIADTTSASYTWKGATGGKNYTFTVRCITSDGKNFASGFDGTGKSVLFLSTPKLTSVSADNSGTVIRWEKVSGAQKYRVYYKNSSGGWTKIADTTSTSYTWKGAKNGTAYTYTVRCITSDEKKFTSGFDNKGISLKAVANPAISSLSMTSTGISISWGKVTDAALYRVYYKNGSSWTRIAETASTSFTWTGAKSGTNYTFTVRCIASDGKTFASGFDTVGKSIKYIAAPKLSSVAVNNSGIEIKWDKVTGAALYRVYYKNSSGGWTKIADTTSASYTWTGAKIGTKYTFTVRCISSDAKSFTSGYDSKGKSITYLSAPKLTSVSNDVKGVNISWSKVDGAKKYRVYYKNESGGWTKIADTTSTDYTWTKAKSGTDYTFTVRCLTDDGLTFTSGFDSTGKGIKYIATPKILSLESTESGIQINWETVNGAELYRVFYKTESEDWTKIADTADLSYTWTEGESGVTYTFTVCCVTSNGKTVSSGFDSTGKSITQ